MTALEHPAARAVPPRTRLGTATALLSVSTAAARAAGLAASVGAAYLLGARELGAYALVAVAAAFLGAAGVLGFAPLCTRAVAAAAGPDDARAVVGFVVRTCGTFLVLLGIGYVALTALVPTPPWRPPADAALELALVPLWGLALGLGSVLQAVVAGHRAFTALGVSTIGRALGVGVLTMAGAAWTRTAAGAACGSVLGEGLALAGLWWWSRRRGWLSGPAVPRNEAPRGDLLRQAVLSGVASLGIQLAVWCGQVLVSRSDDGLVGVGAFLLASRLLLAVTLVPNALAASALPMLSRPQPPRERARLRRRATAAALGSAVPVAVVVVLAATFALPRIDNHYLTYRATVAVMGAVGVAVAANNLYGSLAVAAGRIRVWIASDWVLAGLLLLGSLVLVPAYGALGLAVAYLVAYAGSAALLAVAREAPCES